MAVEIKLDQAVIDQIGQAAQEAAMAAMEALHTELVTSQRMPFDTGDMQNNHTFVEPLSKAEESGARMTVDSPQARRLYYHPEYNFQKINNAKAGGLWWEPWLQGGAHEKFLPETFAKMLKERMP